MNSFATTSSSACSDVIPRAIKRLFHQASIGDQSYRFMFKPGPADEVVAIDCETTGLNVRTDDVITIAAIKIRGNRILTSERFETVVRPDASMRAEEIKVHRLRQADVAQSPLIRKVLPRFLSAMPCLLRDPCVDNRSRTTIQSVLTPSNCRRLRRVSLTISA